MLTEENNDCIKADIHFKLPSPKTSNILSEDTNLNKSDEVQADHKISKLLDEVCKQQQIIAQTSQALNLCAATVEFSGSTESVEGERHLLVASK